MMQKIGPTDAVERNGASRRAEKLSALAAMLGPEGMARLRARDRARFGQPDTETAPDARAVAQQGERLMTELKARWSARAGTSPPARDPAEIARMPVEPDPEKISGRIAATVDLSRLADEHPAVTARVLEGLDRQERIAVLRQLPGHKARAAIQRMKAP